MSRPRVLVACVGNIFLQDDGFGSAVAEALRQRELPDLVRLVDYGIGSVHLVYELLGGYDLLVLVDTVGRQEGPPGSLFVIEPDLPPREVDPDDPLPQVLLDPHDLTPGDAMALVSSLGGLVCRVLVVGCQPMSVDEGLGLTHPVRAAVEPAATLVVEVVERELTALTPGTSGRPTGRH
jgi:hydrogenase maturation protease